eukprot:5037836-Amphidinium_carterae.1
MVGRSLSGGLRFLVARHRREQINENRKTKFQRRGVRDCGLPGNPSGTRGPAGKDNYSLCFAGVGVHELTRDCAPSWAPQWYNSRKGQLLVVFCWGRGP